MTTSTLPKVSDALTWMNCNGSFRAQQAFPGVSGEVSQSRLEGRACHETAQNMFRRDADAPLFGEMVGSLSKDGVVVTQELFDAAREYFNEVWGYCNANDLLQKVQIEEHIPVPGYDNWWCIPDAWTYNEQVKTLKIWDGKFGHRIVDPFEHWPMLIYAFSIVERHHLEPDVIELIVVQPRAFAPGGTVRKWALTPDELVDYRRQVNDTMLSVLDSAPFCTVGSWCKTCTARAGCNTLQNVSYEGIDYASTMQTHELTGHSLGVELKLLRRAEEMIKARRSGLEEQATHELRTGKPVTFFGVEWGKGRERWRKDVPTDQIIMMSDLMGIDARKPVELDTPAQLRKKGIDESVIAEYSETPSTGLKLVEVNERSVKSVFEK